MAGTRVPALVPADAVREAFVAGAVCGFVVGVVFVVRLVRA